MEEHNSYSMTVVNLSLSFSLKIIFDKWMYLCSQTKRNLTEEYRIMVQTAVTVKEKLF